MGFFVYIHTAPNKKRYVGVTHMNPKKRWDCGRGYKQNKHFYAAIQKYGWENFTHQVFEVPSEEAMYRNEQELIELFMTNNPKYGYNKSIGGEKSSFGCKFSEEAKKKLSDAHRRNPIWVGKHHTEETKQKISEAKKGHKLPEEWKHKIGEGLKGHHHTEESKRKMSKNMKGKHSKQIIGIDGVMYKSVTECRIVLGLSKFRFYRMVNTGELRYVS